MTEGRKSRAVRLGIPRRPWARCGTTSRSRGAPRG